MIDDDKLDRDDEEPEPRDFSDEWETEAIDADRRYDERQDEISNQAA